MRSLLRCAAWSGALLLMSGACARAGANRAGIGVGSGTTGWGTKAVVGKREPEALVAADGTICRVAPDRFRATRVGEHVDCNWQ